MDHPNAVIARRLWTALAEGDPDALREILSPGVTWRSTGTSLLAGEFIGADAVLDHLANVGEAADELVSTLEAIYVNNEGAVVTIRTVATRKGRTIEMSDFTRLRIESGRVVDIRSVPFDQRAADAFWG